VRSQAQRRIQDGGTRLLALLQGLGGGAAGAVESSAGCTVKEGSIKKERSFYFAGSTRRRRDNARLFVG
jgi:hypothetical protein